MTRTTDPPGHYSVDYLDRDCALPKMQLEVGEDNAHRFDLARHTHVLPLLIAKRIFLARKYHEETPQGQVLSTLSGSTRI